jgi:Ca2+:H+ antiporter
MAAGGIPWRTLLAFAIVPVSIALKVAGAPDLVVFVAAALAVLPLAHLMGVATEELGKHAGPGVGGLLNATMGNATELIIALALLGRASAVAQSDPPASAALVEIVKASITGSIIGNILLVLGLSLLVGGLRYKTQSFSAKGAELQVTMLALAIAALVMPELFALSTGGAVQLKNVSIVIAVLLIIGYALGLVFSLHTHKDVFNPVSGEADAPVWKKKFALAVLVGATALVGLEAEILVGSLETVIANVGLTEIFVGVIVIAIVGNAAEHGAAVLMAWKNKMDLSVGIATISSTQVALFVTPVLVLAAAAMGVTLTLAFEVFELVAIILSVAIVASIAKDGETNWYEGVLLLLVYGIIAVGFLFHP